MDINLVYFALPDASQLAALDKALERIAPKQDALGTSKRLWINASPNHMYRPFLKARPFELHVDRPQYTQSEIEEFRLSMGMVPKRRLTCTGPEEGEDNFGILLELALEVMQHTKALLKLNDDLARRLFKLPPDQDEFPSQLLAHFPGNVYELAQELDDMGLRVAWFVDARWLRAYLKREHQRLCSSEERQDPCCRFASLDYY